MARLGKRERAQKRLFNTLLREHVQGVTRANFASAKPKPNEFNFVATGPRHAPTGFALRERDLVKELKGNTHTQGIRIGSQLATVEKPVSGAIRNHPNIGQLGTGKPKGHKLTKR